MAGCCPPTPTAAPSRSAAPAMTAWCRCRCCATSSGRANRWSWPTPPATTGSPATRTSPASTCCSLLAVPILSRGTLRAVLLLENRLLRAAFTAGRLDAVKLIAGQLAVSLDNAQLYAEFRQIAGEQAALRRVAMLVARAAPPEAGVRRGRRGGRPAAGGRLRGPGPVRPAGLAHGGRGVDQHGRAARRPRSAAGCRSAGGTSPRWCSGRPGRPGSTTPSHLGRDR